MNQCNCVECIESDNPCFLDCDHGENECVGCWQSRKDNEEIEYEIKQVIDWR